MNVEIAPFRHEHAGRFAELNREWLEKYDLMEPSNEEQLADPPRSPKLRVAPGHRIT